MNAMILKPIITEKSMALAARGTYIFEVPMTSNKIEVARAVKAAFGVDAAEVRVMITKGKVSTNRFKGNAGRRVDVKKAMVKTKAGQHIKAFDMQSEEEAKDAKKADKKVAKAAKADGKSSEETK